METSIEKRIEEQLDGLSKDEIVELNLDSCKAETFDGLTEDFTNLAVLSMINCGITSLKGFPNLPELRRLDLSDNKLSGTLNLLTAACPKLNRLNLGGNKIKEIDALEPLKELADLSKLDLFNCEVTGIEGYREKVFELLPQLVFLDGTNANNEEDEDDDDDDDEDGESDEGSEDEEEEVGLSYLQKSGLEEDSEGEDFEPNGTNNEDDEDDDDDEEDDENMEGEVNGDEEKESPAVPRGRGIKRKRAADEEQGTSDSTEAKVNGDAAAESTEEASNGAAE